VHPARCFSPAEAQLGPGFSPDHAQTESNRAAQLGPSYFPCINVIRGKLVMKQSFQLNKSST